MRLDAEMGRRGILSGRERAKEAISAGLVLVDGETASKPSREVGEETEIVLTADPFGYVSRGGLKLEKAFRVFPGLRVQGKRILDIGASTGGFTDCLLRNGAVRVWAVDVGTGQLDPRLHADPRVVSMEGKDARTLTNEELDGIPDGAVMDVSFISVRKIIPGLAGLLPPGSFLMTLLKPQFEAGKSAVGKHGIVRDPSVHERVLRENAAFVQQTDAFAVEGIGLSPIRGQKGNLEFLLMCRRFGSPMQEAVLDQAVRDVLKEAGEI